MLENLPTAQLAPVPAPAAPASAAMPARPSLLPDRAFHLPDGRPLLITLRREAIMHQTFGGEEGLIACPSDTYQTFCLLWLCAHLPADWNALAHTPDGLLLPLYMRPGDLITTAMDYFEAHFPTADVAGFMALALHLWNHHHGAEVIIDPTLQIGAEPEKKNPDSATPTPPTS